MSNLILLHSLYSNATMLLGETRALLRNHYCFVQTRQVTLSHKTESNYSNITRLHITTSVAQIAFVTYNLKSPQCNLMLAALHGCFFQENIRNYITSTYKHSRYETTWKSNTC